MKIAIITGTMPDIIKQAPIVFEAEKRKHNVLLIHTNQHYDSELFKGMYKSVELREPDYILKKEFTLGNAIDELTELFKQTKPDIVLPHGDTKTAMVAAIAAHYLAIPVGHVEAGLRTESREPWPEQTDTRICDACSNLFFASTELNKKYLLSEGFKKEDIVVCGNSVVDIAMITAKKAKEFDPKIKRVYFSSHREENLRFKERFENVVNFANYLVDEGFEINWVMRPKTEQKLVEYNLKLNKKIIKIHNLPYPKSIELLKNSYFCCTDSGGLQEEASALHIPCLTLRYVTDRPETVKVGCNILTTLEFNKMKLAYKKMIKNYSKMKKIKCPFGDGNTSKKIIEFIEKRQKYMIRWEGR